MKIKSLFTLAVSGVIASSVLMAPLAFADDDFDTNDEPLQILAENGNSNDTAIPDAGMNTNGDGAINNSTGNPTGPIASSVSGNDAGSPDTATGDDDY